MFRKASSSTDILKIIGSILLLVIVLIAGYKLVYAGAEGAKQLINVFKSQICKMTMSLFC